MTAGQFIRNLTVNQWFAIIIAILSALAGATSLLTDIFNAAIAHSIVAVSTLLTTILSSILVQLTSQSSQIKNVNAMPGIEKIVVNRDANKTLAQIAVDPSNKLETVPADKRAIEETATGD